MVLRYCAESTKRIGTTDVKPQGVSRKPTTTPTHRHLLIFQAVLLVAQKPYRTP